MDVFSGFNKKGKYISILRDLNGCYMCCFGVPGSNIKPKMR